MKKIKDMKCSDMKCCFCPLKIKLCQHYIGDTRAIKINTIIELMYKDGKLTFLEYRNAKRKAEQYI